MAAAVHSDDENLRPPVSIGNYKHNVYLSFPLLFDSHDFSMVIP